LKLSLKLIPLDWSECPQKEGPCHYWPRALQNSFCFGNPAIPAIWDPWLSVPRLLVVWLYRNLFINESDLLSAIIMPKEVE
jgi:hypothetical protein